MIDKDGLNVGLVVPCFNEREMLPSTISQLVSFLSILIDEAVIGPRSAITFVDDGSTDDTWQVIEAATLQHPIVRGIKLTRNFGHQNALIAGLMNVEGDAVITIDADLQDDISVIKEMVGHFRAGFEIVYGVREDRSSDSFFKRVSAEIYYRCLTALGVDLVFNHADYRLLGRKPILALREYGEANLFLRNIIPSLGYKSTSVFYARKKRLYGETKYPTLKMLGFAWDGLTSFSPAPLRFITFLGLSTSLISFLVGVWAVIVKIFLDGAVPGWASIVVPIFFLGGAQLLSLGIIGEYIYKIFSEVKKRPRYFIEKML